MNMILLFKIWCWPLWCELRLEGGLCLKISLINLIKLFASRVCLRDNFMLIWGLAAQGSSKIHRHALNPIPCHLQLYLFSFWDLLVALDHFKVKFILPTLYAFRYTFWNLDIIILRLIKIGFEAIFLWIWSCLPFKCCIK